MKASDDYPEPTAQGLYRDAQGDWWVRRSDDGWVLIYWASLSDDGTEFVAPATAGINEVRHNWGHMSPDYMPFTFITPYPGV